MNQQSTFHTIISQLIERLYPRTGQRTRRVILLAYFLQSPARRRSMTLEALGRTDGLEKPVTRERSRQILDEFFSDHLPKEIYRLERGLALDDPIMMANRKDLLYLKEIVEYIVIEIETFEFPIFAWRMQDRLQRLGLVNEKIFFPVIIRIAESFDIAMSFKVDDFNGQRLVFDKKQVVRELTTDIVQFSGKVATHLGGVCSIEAILEADWNPDAPKSIFDIDETIRRKYLLDLFGTEKGLMLLQDKSYYAFKGRDERYISQLVPIFTAYQSIPKDKLIDALIMGIKHRFMTKSKSEKRDKEVSIILESHEAVDEFCKRTLILDSAANDERVPGKVLLDVMSHQEIGDHNQSQIDMAIAIKKKGRPVSSMEFGEIYRNELGVKDSKKAYFYTCLLYTSPSPRDRTRSRMPSSA